MGSNHSRLSHDKKKSRFVDTPITSPPNLSRSSSFTNSRATSIIEKIFHSRSSDMTPKRSLSAPAELWVDKEVEQDRLTNTHFVLKHCFGENISAPVHALLSKPDKGLKTRVLDIACGSGVWVLEMATTYPDSEIYGIDIDNIFPNSIKPSNTHFQQYDILDSDGFPYPDEYFDYIHMRLVFNCFSSLDLNFVLNEINRVLKPGGYIELRDIDPAIHQPGPITNKYFSDFATRMYENHSIDVMWTRRMGEILTSQIEYTDVHVQEVSVKLCKNGLSSMNCSFMDTLKNYKNYLIKTYNMTCKECDEQIELMIQESLQHQSFFKYYMSWARKPLIPGRLIIPKYTKSTNKLIYTPTFEDTECLSTLIHVESLDTALLRNATDFVHLTHGFIE